MGMCKGCGEVFPTVEMENGYCKYCKDGSPKELKIDNTNSSSKNSFETNQKVIVTDIKMPFLSMVFFMVKWVIASIPAFIILFILGSILIGFIGGLGGVFAPQRY
ncbi:MAG: hypothetical protein QM504_00750 [Pseudomonadota bacterium]